MRRRPEWLIPASLIALSMVPALAGTVRLVQVGGGTVTPDNARFLAAPVPIVIHIVSAVLFSIGGALQFAPALRRRSRWHRVVGRALVPAALLVALSGLFMTVTYPWPAGDGIGVFVERLVVGSAMLLFIIRSTVAIGRRRYAEHGTWMTRAYALGLGAGTQVFTHLPWVLLTDARPGEHARTVMMGLGWLINAVVAEWAIRRPAVAAARAEPALRGNVIRTTASPALTR
jgi:uncharacterized membrane protein